jgi:cell division protein FtsN
MKKILLLLSFTLVFISCGSKEPKKEIIPEKKTEEVKTPEVKKERLKPILFFTVQIGAFKNKKARFSSLENVTISSENNMYKYRLGSFETYQEAKSFRKTLLNKFPGAFVQAVKNKQAISIQEAIK